MLAWRLQFGGNENYQWQRVVVVDVGAFWLNRVWAQAPTQWASSTPLALHSHHALGNTPQSSGLEAKGVMKVST